MYLLSLSASMAASVVHGAWLQDKYPEGDVGRFQGIRMIFMVLLPMVIGPPIGALVIESFGEEIIVEGVTGYIPPPHIFVVGALLSILAIIPLLFIKKHEGRIQFELENE